MNSFVTIYGKYWYPVPLLSSLRTCSHCTGFPSMVVEILEFFSNHPIFQFFYGGRWQCVNYMFIKSSVPPSIRLFRRYWFIAVFRLIRVGRCDRRSVGHIPVEIIKSPEKDQLRKSIVTWRWADRSGSLMLFVTTQSNVLTADFKWTNDCFLVSLIIILC